MHTHPNDEINDPAANLLDADADVNSGGDVDYRDIPQDDTDGDTIPNDEDLDDDNDGILDADEDLCGLSAAIAFTSLGQARNVTTAGVYFFELDGEAFSTYVDANGYVQNEGNVECKFKSPYPISYKSIVPKKVECQKKLFESISPLMDVIGNNGIPKPKLRFVVFPLTINTGSAIFKGINLGPVTSGINFLSKGVAPFA